MEEAYGHVSQGIGYLDRRRVVVNWGALKAGRSLHQGRGHHIFYHDLDPWSFSGPSWVPLRSFSKQAICCVIADYLKPSRQAK